MGRQVIKQPNGLYAVWSSVVDHFVMYDMTLEDLIEEQVYVSKEAIEKSTRELVAKLDRGERAYNQFTMTFEEACEHAALVHGKKDKELAEVRKAATTPIPATTDDAGGKS